MHARIYLIAGAATIVNASLLVGCWPFNSLEDCRQNAELACFWTAHGIMGPAATGSGGGGGGTPAGCIPSENSAPVGDGCGVFVSASGDDTNPGTQVSPVATLSKAVALAKKGERRVYACAETFKEALTLDDDVELYGGLDCKAAWAYVGDASKTTLTASADEIPLVLKSGVGAGRVEDVAIVAADAAMIGGSSIALLADGVTAEFVRCEITAGNGAKGAAGIPGDLNGMPATAGAAGNSGKDACSDVDGTPGPDPLLPGGGQVPNNCSMGDLSLGGPGGNGAISAGLNGTAGQTGTKGQPGLGEPNVGAWDCSAGSGLGATGSVGEAGAPGIGATGLGTISASGYMGTSGGEGTSGKAGQGGGGGGGAKGGMICAGSMTGSGASGGSGGAGGCGGLPGKGGGPGGASIALMSLKASITLTDCTLLSTKGGDGGLGGDAQGGGPGGKAGDGGMGVGVSNPGCNGGQGGKGGNGGPGGGGLGGPSFGIAFTGSAVDQRGSTKISAGTAGAGGPGGSVNVAMNAGEAGKAADEQLFAE